MPDGSIILDIEARDAGLVKTLEQARTKAAQAAASMEQLCRSVQQTATVSNSTRQAMRSLFSSVDQTGKSVTNLTSAFRQQQSGVLGAMNAMVSGTVSLARSASSQLRQAGTNWGTSLTSGLRSGLSGVNSASQSGVNSALNPWKSAGSSAFSLGYAIPSGAAQGMNAGSNLVSQAAGLCARSAQGAFSGGNWGNLGYQISSGIARGISSGSSLITAAARSAAQSALTAAKKSLGIHSPSRLFRDEIGKMIPAGMAEGILDGAGELGNAMNAASQRLISFSRQTLQPSAAIPAAQTLNAVTHTVQTAPQSPVVLEAPLYLDGREIARASARYTGRQMAFLEGL